MDLPTPPLPLSTRILCLTPESREVMMGISGSGPLGAVAQMDWLGHPAHASLWPASLDSGPGQCSGVVIRIFTYWRCGAHQALNGFNAYLVLEQPV